MVLDDEIVGLRSRLDRLQRSLRFIDEPVATALIKGVIADMEARIAAVESDRQHRAGEGVKAPRFQLRQLLARLRRIAWHFRGRITCRIRSRLGEWLRRFKGRITWWIMHRFVGRITFGGSDWIVERLRRTCRSRGHRASFLFAFALPPPTPPSWAGFRKPTAPRNPQNQRFLFTAPAALFAASFTAAFASPVAF
jgi:hypothetical protein